MTAKKADKRTWGRLRQLKSKNWQASYTDSWGSVVNAPVTFKTKKDAEGWLAEKLVLHNKGLLNENSSAHSEATSKGRRITLRQHAEEWRLKNSVAGLNPLRPRTVLEYERYMNNVLSDLADKPLGSISALDVERWFTPLAEKTPNQAVKVYSHLKTLMNDAQRLGMIVSNPCNLDRRQTHVKKPDVQVPNHDQVATMIENAPGYWPMLIELAAWGGFRKGELLELRRKDIRPFEHNGETVTGPNGLPVFEVMVHRAVMTYRGKHIVGEPKTEESKREVVMPPRSSAMIQAYLSAMPKSSEALLFPASMNPDKHLHDKMFFNTWSKIRNAAGYTGNFHSLRAFALSAFAETGATLAQIKRRGGHTRAETAMKYQRNLGTDFDRVAALG